ncbi:hypothetical protein ILYODFUR_009502 [Ilyodon furcidens]|uniref:Uncharacterized protein n=1 Tax=Ilyodon furcidens TaxID=33524 RepID=A0ABV0T6X9_9TELE
MNLITAPLAAPLVLAVWNPQQQSTITHLYVHPYDTPPLASPPGRQNKEIITNKHPSPPPANLSLCGYTHLSSLELHHLSNMSSCISPVNPEELLSHLLVSIYCSNFSLVFVIVVCTRVSNQTNKTTTVSQYHGINIKFEK